jgi:hypothetical protein
VCASLSLSLPQLFLYGDEEWRAREREREWGYNIKDYIKLDLTDVECHLVPLLIVIYEIIYLFPSPAPEL